MPIQSINPANGTLLRSFTPLTQRGAAGQDRARRRGLRGTYADVPLSHRALCMRKLASLLEQETAELAALITAEMGKPIVPRAPRSSSAQPSAITTPTTPPVSSPRSRVDIGSTTPAFAGTRSESSSRHALELPFLAGLSLPRSRVDGRQRRPAQARLQRPPVRACHRSPGPPRRLSPRHLPDAAHRGQPGRDGARRRARSRSHRHRKRNRRPRHRRTGGMAHQEVRPRTRRQRSLHRDALGRPRRSPSTPPCAHAASTAASPASPPSAF
jgi:hypothetical protein